ncbi:MAG: hypothetical protein JO061_05940 [Acidobacteriaceae bacterium]|nr:hypothetical protein [Acidobacteriaceae bacterium]
MNDASPHMIRITRRQLALSGLAATSAIAQVTSPVPPQGTPKPAPPSASPAQKLDKAYDDIRAVSKRLSAIEIPIDIEPAFTFKP